MAIVRRRRRGLSSWCLAAAVVVGLAVLPEPVAAAPNPADNIKMGALPQSCYASGGGASSAACENSVVYYLDKARASLGLPPYPLPADFVQLSPDRQIFVLSNLDRIAYSLPPVAGLNGKLGEDAAAGVADGDDPTLGEWPYGWGGYYSNWAGGYTNTPEAYYGWMYDDGYGSGNLACTKPSDWGCWGHRENVLFDLEGAAGYEAAMGASAGQEAKSGSNGYAMLIVAAHSHFEPQPPYSYTWAEAVADGAGSNAYDPGTPDLSAQQEPQPGPATTLRIDRRGSRLWIHGSDLLLGRTVEISVRREIIPCAIRLKAPRCTWVRREAVHRMKRSLTGHTLIRIRPPGPWERVAVRARIDGFTSEGQRHPFSFASQLLLGPKPHRFAH